MYIVHTLHTLRLASSIFETKKKTLDRTYDLSSSSDGFVRVEPENPLFGSDPSAVQTGGCGERGRHVRVGREYLLNQVRGNLFSFVRNLGVLTFEFI